MKTPKPRMRLPEIQSETHLSIPDHEVLLAFNGDEDALMFHDWWNEVGIGIFMQWADKPTGTE